MKFFSLLALTILLSWSAWASEAVNINTASAEKIADTLKGIGLSKAELIVAYREQNGAFEHIDELVNVKGVGIKTVDNNRGMILLRDPVAK